MKKTILLAAAIAVSAAGFAASEAVAGPESKCKACHTFDKGGKNKNGPNLFAIVGSKVGNAEGYKYSPSLKNGSWVWDEEKLKVWVCNSKQGIKDLTGDDSAKTRMGNQKRCGEKAEAVVAFLKTLK